MVSGSRRDSVGGGGGGVVAEFFFSVASKSRRDSVGGGSTRNFPLMGPAFPKGGPGPPPLNRSLL